MPGGSTVARFLLTAVVCALPLTCAEQAPVSFNREIRPIMADTCFRCHGPDKSSRMANMRLDLRDEATKTNSRGVTPIVPGNPDASAIIQRIFAKTPAKMMPPAYSHKVLTETQKETIRRWVAEGAKYEGHWAYQAVKRPAVPEVQAGAVPVRNPVDAFIRERLAREGLSASAEADRRVLLRRVYLDLTGLPPTPEEVRAFVGDTSPQAYEKVVDRLLGSPRYAEKQAMLWLDSVRYADTAGFHGDNPVPAWPYRDYVLRAFRDNKPFDEFTREQIAGDLLAGRTREQLVASAFNRLGRMSAEGGIQEKEYIAKYGADRVRTVSAAWLGATTGCAECHDHKFDPILTKDFYALKAFFADVKETGLVADSGPRAWGSKLALPDEAQTSALEALRRDIYEARCALEAKATAAWKQQSEWEKALLARHEQGELAWKFQRPLTAVAKNGSKLTIFNDEEVDYNFYLRGSLASERGPGMGLVVASGALPDNDTYTVTFKPGAGTWRALAIEAQQDEGLPAVRLSRGGDRFLITEVEAEAAGRGNIPFVLATSTAFGERPENGAMLAIDGDAKTGWGVAFGEHRSPMLALRFARALDTGTDTVVTVRIRHDGEVRRALVGRFRLALSGAAFAYPDTGDSGAKNRAKQPGEPTLSVAADRGVPPAVVDALRMDESKRSPAQRDLLLRHFIWAHPEFQADVARLAKLEASRDLLDASVPRVLVTEATQPRETRILPRGDWMNDTGRVVEPAIPEFLGKLNTQGRATRLDLANWIVSRENPLTARVFVNRMWREFFGTGLSKVLDDLGSQGEWPAHPELLDWLAAEFMEPSYEAAGTHAWDVKHVVRTLVLSHTYRQSSLPTPELEQKDPDNRLLARQSRMRVEAEMVRDINLAVSGLLTERFGGPSVRPYQPDGYLLAMNFPKRDYSASRGEELYRRGVYLHWQRTFLHPSLVNFDAPSREECTVNRVTSNTPLQALELLNDPIYVEAARAFAERILTQGGKALPQQINWAFERAVSRTPSQDEQRVLVELFNKNLGRYRAAPEAARGLVSIGEAPRGKVMDAARLAAMTTVARVVLNLHEVITRN